jgi:hypothetical protein
METFVNENTQRSQRPEKLEAHDNTTNRGKFIGFAPLTFKQGFARFLRVLGRRR